ncbi:MAG: ArsR/SmtB family transcription factor [Halobacteriaceae archaeon]
MDSGALLDLLGNENRRRILRLLSQKPCYVTEISDYLGVSPKAVIDHLQRLEEAGLVESRVDDRRRKYFHISRNLRLEVNVSPYSFGMKSAYPASANLDLTRCHYLSVEVENGEADAADEGGVSDLAAELDRLEELERELSLAQRWVQGRIADVQDRIADSFEEDVDERLFAAVLRAVADGSHTTDDVAEAVGAPREVVAEALSDLRESGHVRRGDEGWTLV